MREAVFSRAMGGLAKIGLEGTHGEASARSLWAANWKKKFLLGSARVKAPSLV
jgi:hypothetical protein